MHDSHDGQRGITVKSVVITRTKTTTISPWAGSPHRVPTTHVTLVSSIHSYLLTHHFSPQNVESIFNTCPA